MYISYNVVDGNEYATAVRSVRSGSKVTKEDRVYLGRVVDKERGIYRSRERGLFTYDVATGEFGRAPDDAEAIQPRRRNARQGRPRLSYSFGDVFLLCRFLHSSGLMACADACGHPSADTVRALLCFYVLTSLANRHAQDWWELTFASLLFPGARISSQRVSEVLADLGSEDAKRRFMRAYLALLGRGGGKAKGKGKGPAGDGGILIDSTGLPNCPGLPCTAVSNHNGEVSEEVRLIYVVQQGTGLPLFFRYVAGNVVDVSTVTRTIAELKAMGVNTKFAILDAGYHGHANAEALMDARVSFLTRTRSTFTVYKDLVRDHLAGLECRENAVLYHGRFVYVECHEVALGSGGDRRGYAYLCKDSAMRRELERDAARRATEKGTPAAAAFDKLAEQGVFVLVGSRRIAREKLLDLYYTRDQVEKVFEVCKQDAKALPVAVQSEETFRGHLLMCFMATVAHRMMADVLTSKAPKSGLTVSSMLAILHEQHAIDYDGQYVTTEPTKKMSQAYKAFGIKCPEVIRDPTGLVVG